ncbi:MAG: DUF423 domain-containing protein [Rhodothermales bacterium]|nr:DUF423 domain-containing protein [Rhodothermales bacterium]
MYSMLTGKNIAFVGAVLSGVAVLVGAFGAHALKDTITPDRMATYQTAVTYMMWHSFATILAGVGYHFKGERRYRLAGLGFLIGIVLFCGSLFTLVLTNVTAFGAIAPIGGTCFAAAWILLAVAFRDTLNPSA